LWIGIAVARWVTVAAVMGVGRPTRLLDVLVMGLVLLGGPLWDGRRLGNAELRGEGVGL
jgi:hypothetical protein